MFLKTKHRKYFLSDAMREGGTVCPECDQKLSKMILSVEKFVPTLMGTALKLSKACFRCDQTNNT